MGATGSAVARAAALGACAALVACATPPKLSPDELERQLTARLGEVRELDAKLSAFQAANTAAHAPPSATGANAQGAYYNPAGVKIQAVDPRAKSWVRDTLSSALQKRGAARVDYRNAKGAVEFLPPWPAQSFEGVPLEVQLAASVTAGSELRGAESDMRLPLEAGGARLITVWNDSGDRIQVLETLAPALPPVGASAPSAEQLSAHFGVGPIVGWSRSELASLDSALALLDPAERAAIAGLPFHRESKPSGEFELPPMPKEMADAGGTHCGLFIYKGTSRWIEVYDCAFANEEVLFVGSPERPLRPSTRAILHEIGHALGKKEMLDLRIGMTEHSLATHDLWDEYTRQAKDVPSGYRRRFQGMGADLTDLVEITNRWNEVLKTPSLGTPAVMQRFDQIRGGVGFTAYGRSSSDEAFAEAFSLYRADPDACRRISPPVFAFFEAGQHLSATP